MNAGRAALSIAGWCAIALSFAFSCSAAEPPLPPKPATYFSDNAGIVNSNVASYLNRQLEQFERETSNQLVVAIYRKLPEGSELNDYVFRTYQSWAIGQKGKDNGVLMMAFIDDRKIRIEVGYGLEGALPDSVAARIIREVIAPHFKAGAYGSGLEEGVDAIISATKGEYQGTGHTVADTGPSSGLMLSQWALILLIVALVIWFHLGDTMIQRGGRTVVWGILSVLASARTSSGGSGGGGGGGGFSGGGGSSGGGGASGSW
jgi:uncharacterized protein